MTPNMQDNVPFTFYRRLKARLKHGYCPLASRLAGEYEAAFEAALALDQNADKTAEHLPAAWCAAVAEYLAPSERMAA